MSLKPGPNARGSGRAASRKEIAGKRSQTTIKAIKKKQEDGTAHGNERASIRVGVGVTNVLTGKEDLSEWDDEELRRGYRRDRNGRFQGRAPKVIPKAIHDELVRRTLANAGELLRENLETAVQVLTEIVTGVDVEERDKIKAIQIIMDRVMGKAPDKVEVTGETPRWMLAMQGGVVTVNSPSVVVEEDEEDEEGD